MIPAPSSCSARSRRGLAALSTVALLQAASAGSALAAQMFNRLYPTPATTNQAVLHLNLVGINADATSQVGSASSYLDFSFDSTTRLLQLKDARLSGTNVTFVYPGADVTATNLLVAFAPDAEGAPIPQATVSAIDGTFSNMSIPVRVTGEVFLGATDLGEGAGVGIIQMAGHFVANGATTVLTIDDFSGSITPPIFIPIQSITAILTGEITLNFSSDVSFIDGFESGNFTAWDSVTGGGP